MDGGLVVEQLTSRPDVHDAAGVEHDGVARDALYDAKVLLDEQHGRELRDAFERERDLGDEQGRQALRGLVRVCSSGNRS